MSGPVDRIDAPDVRILRRLKPMDRRDGAARRPGMLAGCALDCETTGLDVRGDAIIELAVQRFWADASGRILETGPAHVWREDPGRPVPPQVQRVTGLTSADVEGRAISEGAATSLIADAHFVVAHNAAFDRPFVERRLPLCAGRPWVCTLADVDWRAHGYEGRALGHLLLQMGWFYDAHRADVDVAALLHLLDHPLSPGRTVLREAVGMASRATWRVEAVDAPFGARDLLKARGYRWDPADRFWWREVEDGDVDNEIAWSVGNVYVGRGRPRFLRVDWRTRYAIS